MSCTIVSRRLILVNKALEPPFSMRQDVHQNWVLLTECITVFHIFFFHNEKDSGTLSLFELGSEKPLFGVVLH